MVLLQYKSLSKDWTDLVNAHWDHILSSLWICKCQSWEVLKPHKKYNNYFKKLITVTKSLSNKKILNKILQSLFCLHFRMNKQKMHVLEQEQKILLTSPFNTKSFTKLFIIIIMGLKRKIIWIYIRISSKNRIRAQRL